MKPINHATNPLPSITILKFFLQCLLKNFKYLLFTISLKCSLKRLRKEGILVASGCRAIMWHVQDIRLAITCSCIENKLVNRLRFIFCGYTPDELFSMLEKLEWKAEIRLPKACLLLFISGFKIYFISSNTVLLTIISKELSVDCGLNRFLASHIWWSTIIHYWIHVCH